MSNTCGWSSADGNTQALMDVICTAMQTWCEGTDWNIGPNTPVWDVAEQTSNQAHALIASVAAVNVDVDNVYGVVADPTSGNPALLDGINGVGDQVSDVQNYTQDIGTAFTKSGGGAVYPTPNANNIAEDFVNTRTAMALITTVNSILQARLGVTSGPLGDLISNVEDIVKDITGAGKAISLQSTLQSYMPAPPINQLTVDTYHATVDQAVDAIPAGVYGARFILTVPSHWGKLDTWPFYYTPSIARIDYASIGFYGFNPIAINTDFILAYPFPSWADSVVVSLGVGVTAERAWLYLPH